MCAGKGLATLETLVSAVEQQSGTRQKDFTLQKEFTLNRLSLSIASLEKGEALQDFVVYRCKTF